MTLRLRLVLALVALMLVGLGLFGFVTYSLYSRAQYSSLDDQIRGSVPFVTRQLHEQAGLSDGSTTSPPSGSDPDKAGDNGGSSSPPPVVPLATYSEIRSSTGAVIAKLQVPGSTATPKLPTDLGRVPPGRFFTTGSRTGSGSWRVYVTADARAGGRTVAVAVPTNDVHDALDRLTLIEATGAASLLAILCVGAWIILRRGLRPLEQMAGTAGEIAAGDLSQRVATPAASSEVGRLGLALNSMLDKIEAAFRERDATERRLRQFLSDASHELRTPLTSIQGFAELFRIGDEDRVDLPTILRRIEEETARMKVLVEDLLLLARLDETRPSETEPVDLAVIAADACSDAVATAPDRPVVLDAPEPVVARGDQGLLRQAVANLVTNAVRHTPTGTGIEVSAHVLEGNAIVQVRDHGGGLDDEALDRIFDRFWQADKARSGAGAGLGLPIVAGIAAEHGGTVSAENAPREGAVFTIRIPLS